MMQNKSETAKKETIVNSVPFNLSFYYVLAKARYGQGSLMDKGLGRTRVSDGRFYY